MYTLLLLHVNNFFYQPRKFIFDLFDSLILLGVGGKLIYHGPTVGAEPYFGILNYKLPKGESVADWLIDISSGRLEQSSAALLTAMEKKRDEKNGHEKRLSNISAILSFSSEKFQSSSFNLAVENLAPTDGATTDDHRVGKTGVTTGKVVQYVYCQ